MIPGTLILDANAIWRLEDPALQDRVLRSLLSVHVAFRPTAINLLEVARIRNKERRERLFATLRALACGLDVRPLPSEVLRLVGLTMAAGASEFRFPPSRYEWMLYESHRITDQHIEEAERHLENEQREFDRIQREARREIRAFLKKAGTRDPWGDIPTFLDLTWTHAKHLDTYIERSWRTLQLPGLPDVEQVLANDAWRLYYEGMGAAAYERAVMAQTPSPIDLADIEQLVYLAGNGRRFIVSDDKDVQRVASAVLNRRYAGARVMTVNEFIDLAS